MLDSTNAEDTRRRVARIVAEEIMPMLQMDNNGIEVVAVENGVVQVRLLGVCGCCPGSVHAVLMGIEDELRRRIPEVEYLEMIA